MLKIICLKNKNKNNIKAKQKSNIDFENECHKIEKLKEK